MVLGVGCVAFLLLALRVGSLGAICFADSGQHILSAGLQNRTA